MGRNSWVRISRGSLPLLRDEDGCPEPVKKEWKDSRVRIHGEEFMGKNFQGFAAVVKRRRRMHRTCEKGMEGFKGKHSWVGIHGLEFPGVRCRC